MHKPRWCHWPASPPRCQHGARDEHSPAPACAQRLMVRWLSHFVTPQAPAQQQRALRDRVDRVPVTGQPAPPAPARVQRQSPPPAVFRPPPAAPAAAPADPGASGGGAASRRPAFVRGQTRAAAPARSPGNCRIYFRSDHDDRTTQHHSKVRMIETSQALQKKPKSTGGVLGGVVRPWPALRVGAGSQGNSTLARGVVGSILAAKGISSPWHNPWW
jgi:hypothetical protein